MSQLKYIITADDSDFKKKIAEVAKLASQSGGKMVADVNEAVDKEVRKRKDVTKVIEEQTAAIQKRNREEAKAPVRKPVPFEIVRGDEGVISSGTVVSPKDIERAAAANQAYAASTQMAKAGLEKQAGAAAKVSTATVTQLGLMESMKDKLNDLKRAQDTASDPIKLQTYNKEIQKTEAEIQRMGNAGKAGFDNMGNAIKKSTSLMGKAWSSLRMLANILPGVGIAGLIAFAIDPIVKWIGSMGDATEATKAMNAVRQTSASTIAKEVAETQLLIDKINSNNLSETQRQSLLNEFIAKNPAVLSALNLQNIATMEGKGIIDDYIVSLKEKIRLHSLEQGYINAVQKAADARSGALSEETDLKWYNKVARTAGDIAMFRTQEDTQKYIEETNKKRREESGKTYDVIADNLLKEIEAEISAVKKVKEVRDTSLKALETQLAQTNERLRSAQSGEDTKTLQAEKKALEAQISQREKMLGLDKKKKTGISAEAKAITAAQNMYDRIDGLRQEYTRKVMSQDEAEIQSARDKFANLAADIAKFNANPKNKVKVSMVGVDELRDQVIADLQAKQQAARDKIAAEEKEKSLKEALELAETHEQALTRIQKKYADARKEIGDKITKDQEAVLNARMAKETEAVNRTLVEELDSYRNFFGNLSDLSGVRLNQGAQALITDLDKLVEKYPELKKIADLIKKDIAGAKVAKTAEEFRDMADSLSFMADALGDVSGGLADAFRTASNLAGQISNMKTDMEAFALASKNGSVTGQIASGLGIIGAGFNIMTTLNTFLDRTTAADEQRLRNSEIQLQATEGMTKALERQIRIANEAYGTQKIEEYTRAVEQANKTIEESSKALSGRYAFTGDAELDKVIEKMNKGEKLKGWTLWGDSEKDLARIIKQYPKLTTNVEELQRLLDSGKLDSQTAAIAQNFINAHDAIEESKNAIIAFNTAIDFDTLSDNLIDAISSGEDAVDSLGKNFEDTMRNAILNSLKDGAYQKQMQKFYEDFDKAMESGLTEQEVAALRSDYDRIAAERRARMLELERVSGIDLDGSEAEERGQGMSGTIGRSITEDTANKWMGVQLNMYAMAKKQYDESLKQTTGIIKYSEYGFQMVQSLAAIVRNTGDTAKNTERLAAIETHLSVVANNTKAGRSAADMGYTR